MDGFGRCEGRRARRGLGKVRHMELKYLWIQEAVKRKRVVMRKIKGSMNPADNLAKPQNRTEYEELLKTVGGKIRSDVVPD